MTNPDEVSQEIANHEIDRELARVKENEPKLPKSIKVRKYFANRTRGDNKTVSAIKAGYSPRSAMTNTSHIETSPAYQACERWYKNVLLNYISLDDIAKTSARNIMQSSNYTASNQALQYALSKLEGDSDTTTESDAVVSITLKDSDGTSTTKTWKTQ